jgi:hypothetical protein
MLFPWEQSDWGIKLTTHLRPVPKLRLVELYLHLYVFMAVLN